MNQEKYFYSALQRFRDEQLEDYYSTAAGVSYSASDYHHVRQPIDRAPTPAVLSTNERSKSQYSILNEDHRRSTPALRKPSSSSVASYDPFRASREPVLNAQPNYVNVTVHRGGSKGSQKRNAAPLPIPKHADSLRVETLRKCSRRISGVSRTSVSATGSPQRRVPSRVRMGSSSSANNATIIQRPVSTYKRGVSFVHLRDGSASSYPSNNPDTRSRRSLVRPKRKPVGGSASSESSPLPQIHVARIRKDGNKPSGSPTKNQKARITSHYIEHEARKVSTELENFCNEAFFRSSVSSSLRTSVTGKPAAYETPPSSVSYDASRNKEASGNEQLAARKDFLVLRDRPLPALPAMPIEPQRTFITRELVENRNRATAACVEEDSENHERFQDVLRHLNQLLRSPTEHKENDGARISSAPEPRQSVAMGHLPIISEECKAHDARGDDAQDVSSGKRAVTDPVRPHCLFFSKGEPAKNTIRLVPSSPTPILPLNIIKRPSPPRSVPQTGGAERDDRNADISVQPLPGAKSHSSRKRGVTNDLSAGPHSSNREGNCGDAKDTLPKMKDWFRRKFADKQVKGEARSNGVHVLVDGDPSAEASPREHGSEDPRRGRMVSDPATSESNESEFPMRAAPTGERKKGLLKLFAKRKELKPTTIWQLDRKSSFRRIFHRSIDYYMPSHESTQC